MEGVTRVARASLVVALVLVACTQGRPPTRPTLRASLVPLPSFSVVPVPPSPAPSLSPPAFLPAPDAPIPTDPAQLAAALVEVTTALRASIDAWRNDGDVAGPIPEPVVLQALYQQRLYRTLPRNPSLSAATLPRLPRWLRGEAGAVVKAAALLFGLTRPISKPSTFRTGAPEPAGVLLRYYREAERKFGIDWEILAALNYVESKFGRVKSTSYAGAQGPMQFIPSTWAAYGMGGDIDDPHDAILGAANYLRQSGAPGDYRQALYAYNHAWEYVDAVLLYAGRMRHDIRNYFAFYNWQVFVLTTKGDQRLTGPGLEGSA
jgi:hypothetical protein